MVIDHNKHSITLLNTIIHTYIHTYMGKRAKCVCGHVHAVRGYIYIYKYIT